MIVAGAGLPPHVVVLEGASERMRAAVGAPDRGITFPRRRGRPRKVGDSPVTGVAEVPETKAPRRRALVSPTIEPRLYDVPAAAVYMGISEDLVRELVARGVLRRVRIPAPITKKRSNAEVRKILLDRADLDAQIVAWREAPLT